MTFIYLIFLSIAYFSHLGVCQNIECQIERELSGIIEDSFYDTNGTGVVKCKIIEVAEDSYMHLNMEYIDFKNHNCAEEFIIITITGTGEVFKYCYNSPTNKTITAFSNVNVTSSITGKYKSSNNYQYSRYSFVYFIESVSCTQKNHFRCSEHVCLHRYQVCDGVLDCYTGVDEVGCETGVKLLNGVNASRENAIDWLKNQSLPFFGWRKNTHRAITALYLAGDARSVEKDLDEEFIVKQLELQISVAFLSNSTNPLTVSELSMFVNALLVTCHDPRKFFGLNLLQILSDRLASSKLPSPGSYLTLCNADWTFSESDVRSLLNLLHEHSEYPFLIDIQAMTVMALTCIKNKMSDVFEETVNSTNMYDETIQKLIGVQEPDGSFGNVYTTALVTQALLSSMQKYNWFNRTLTLMYLMQHLNTSPDFLSSYWILPILNDKNLIHMADVNCSKIRNINDDITNVTDDKMLLIQYSLYIGDLKDVVHSIYLGVPENSTAYDVMKAAQVMDSKYKFSHKQVNGRMYVYEIAGITNDPDALKFWLLYTGDVDGDGKLHHHTKSPDTIVMSDKEHLIMWFKSLL